MSIITTMINRRKMTSISLTLGKWWGSIATQSQSMGMSPVAWKRPKGRSDVRHWWMRIIANYNDKEASLPIEAANPNSTPVWATPFIITARPSTWIITHMLPKNYQRTICLKAVNSKRMIRKCSLTFWKRISSWESLRIK